MTAYDSPIYIADAALYLMNTQPDLGIENPYALDDDQLAAAVEVLKSQKENVSEYWSDYLKEIQAFKTGDTQIGTTWQVIASLAQSEGAPVEAFLPEEGSTGWSDTWMISAKAKNPNCGYAWMDYIASPEAQAAVAEWFGEAPANPKACDLTSDTTFCDTYHVTDSRLRRADPLLDHADRAVPGRSHRREVHRLRRLDDRVDGDQGLRPVACRS